MEEQLISFETAKLAKEKGFNISTQKAYIGESLFVNFEESFGESEFYFDADDFYNDWNKKGWFFDKKGNGCFGCNLDNIKWFEAYAAPTQSLLQKWLRDIHGIHIIIIPTVTSSWTYKIVSVISQRDDDVIKGIKNVSDLPPYKEVCGYDFNTFEDALEDALFESLKLI